MCLHDQKENQKLTVLLKIAVLLTDLAFEDFENYNISNRIWNIRPYEMARLHEYVTF